MKKNCYTACYKHCHEAERLYEREFLEHQQAHRLIFRVLANNQKENSSFSKSITSRNKNMNLEDQLRLDSDYGAAVDTLSIP